MNNATAFDVASSVADNRVAQVALAVLVLAIAIRHLRGSFVRPRDPQRLFTTAQRLALFARAGNRCEAKPLLGRRCRNPATAGDHIYPWSKGGATTMANGAALCSGCNRRKSATVPSAFALWRMERRRAKYFPPHQRCDIEWRTLSRPG